MPIIDPEESLQSLIDLAGARETIEQEAQNLYPSDPLSMNERQRLGMLSRRARRLQPTERLQFGQVGSPAQAGNPFSVDTRSATQGLGNLGLGIVNRLRQDRRGEFEDDLSGLTRREREDRQAEEDRQELTRDRTAAAMDEDLRAQRESGVERTRQEGRMERDRSQHEQNLAEIEAREEQRRKTDRLAHDLKNDPNNPEARKVVYQEARDAIISQFPEATTIENRIDRLTSQRNALIRDGAILDSDRERIQDIDSQLSKLDRDLEDVTRQMGRAWIRFNPAMADAFSPQEIENHLRTAMRSPDLGTGAFDDARQRVNPNAPPRLQGQGPRINPPATDVSDLF